MARKLKTSSLQEFSSKLVRFYKLPNGIEIRLYRKKSGRRVRSDFTIKRKAINKKTISQLDDSWNVKEFLDEIKDIMSTDVDARGFELQLFCPDGYRLNGNTLLGSVRALDPVISEDEDKAFDIFLALLDSCGLEETSIRQAGKLYHNLNDMVDGSLDFALIRNEAKIYVNGL